MRRVPPTRTFEELLHEALARNLEPDEEARFLALGDEAMFERDSRLDEEDYNYLLGSLSRIFRLREPDTERVYRAWRFNIFDRPPRYEMTDFSVAQLREMSAEERWSAEVMKPLGLRGLGSRSS